MTVAEQLHVALTQQGRTFTYTKVIDLTSRGPGKGRGQADENWTWIVDGRHYAPFQAADEFLEGGWSGAWDRYEAARP